MALGDLQNESNLYINWINVLSSISNVSSACTGCLNKISALEAMTGFNAAASQAEIDYMNEVQALVNNFLNALPAQPE